MGRTTTPLSSPYVRNKAVKRVLRILWVLTPIPVFAAVGEISLSIALTTWVLVAIGYMTIQLLR